MSARLKSGPAEAPDDGVSGPEAAEVPTEVGAELNTVDVETSGTSGATCMKDSKSQSSRFADPSQEAGFLEFCGSLIHNTTFTAADRLRMLEERYALKD